MLLWKFLSFPGFGTKKKKKKKRKFLKLFSQTKTLRILNLTVFLCQLKWFVYICQYLSMLVWLDLSRKHGASDATF